MNIVQPRPPASNANRWAHIIKMKNKVNRMQLKQIYSLLFLPLLLMGCSVEATQNSNPLMPATATVVAPPMPTATLEPTITPTKPPAFAGLAPGECVDMDLPGNACTGVTSNQQWEPVIREFNQVEMVLVPAGCFQMGNNDGFPEEQPVHNICFDEPFWIDLTEVTVSQFANFLNAQPEPVDSLSNWLDTEGHLNNEYRYQLLQKNAIWYPLNQKNSRPLERVTWVGANDYCNWREARLPTEAEWEYAARGPDNFLYPWGNEIASELFVIGYPPDVGSTPEGASWVGALDMACSLFEWTSSLYESYPYAADDGREASFEENSTGMRVFRGSPWYHSNQKWDNISATARFEGFTNYGYWYHGFRCARSIE